MEQEKLKQKTGHWKGRSECRKSKKGRIKEWKDKREERKSLIS